jgi:alpha-L-fucosidase 2
MYHLNSTGDLPEVTFKLGNELRGHHSMTICAVNSLTYKGYTNGEHDGMQFFSRVQLIDLEARENKKFYNYCNGDTLIVPEKTRRELTLVIGAETDYSERHGNEAARFLFKQQLQTVATGLSLDLAGDESVENNVRFHTEDYASYFDQVSLSLGEIEDSPAADLGILATPATDALLFDYGRYLFISTSRSNSLPPNLAGRWESSLNASASDDYHLNGNFQMCYQSADQVGLGDLQTSLWALVGNTLAPRGRETAKLLYNAPGWVVHGSSNIFGHTGLLPNAQSSHYPLAAASLTNPFWDHYEYNLNTTWYKEAAYPFIRGVAEFWISQLQEDKHANDSTLVVNPCNSPEHGPTTYGCTQHHHMIWEVFDKVLKSVSVVGETDQAFVNAVSDARRRLDPAFRIGAWGQIQEYKLPIEIQKYQTNHIPQLYGVHPGYYLARTLPNELMKAAVETTLMSRDEVRNGWANVARAALWATIGRPSPALAYLHRGLSEYFAPNMLSTTNKRIRIDGNCGYVNAMLAMLIYDKPIPYSSKQAEQVVILGPAIPATWGAGHMRGLRLRNSGTVDFWWNDDGVVTTARLSNRVGQSVRLENVNGNVVGVWRKAE